MEIKNLVSLKVLEDRYLKDGETLDQQIDRISTAVSSVEKDKDYWKDKFKDIIDQRLFIPAGRIISGAGVDKKLTLSNCFTMNFVPDSMDEIFNYVKYGALVHKQGGGTGYNYSLIRPNGVPTSNDAIASGVVSFMNVFDAQTKCVNAGSRRGANMSMLYILHPDILEYIDAKSYTEDKLTQFNMSVLVDDKFMNAVKRDEEVNLIYPCMTKDGDILTEKDEGVKVFKTIRARELWDKITYKAYMNGEPGVIFYDNLNKFNNTYYIEKIVTCNPCSEYISGVVKGHDDYFGACNLGSLFLHNFVVDPFKENAHIDKDKLTKTVEVAVRFLDDVLDINRYPLDNFKKYQDNMRTIGLGISGLADMLTMLNMKYSSKEAIKFVDNLMELITYTAYKTSNELAKEKGKFPLFKKEFIYSGFLDKYKHKIKWADLINNIEQYGIRNARLISIAPCGSISIAYGENCSSGIEPIFSLEYDRKIHVGGQSEDDIQIYKMKDYAYKLWEETEDKSVERDVFETALSLSVDAHVNMLSVVGKHVDMSISKTINIPTEYSFEDTKEVYFKCWENGIRGCTIFRPNEIRQGILLAEGNKVEDTKELKRGEYEKTPDNIIEIKRKLVSGCGKMMLHIGIIPEEKRIFDVYVTNSSKGGCTLNIQNLAITMSNALRTGSNLESLKKSFEGAGACPSYAMARAKGKKVSKGSSCGLSILYALLDVEEDLKEEKLVELQKLGYYNSKPVNVMEEKNDDEEVFTEEEKKYLKEYGEIAFAKKYHKCPICGNDDLATGDGCITDVTGCGWTKC